jgi:hypothetical protein
VTPEQRKQIRTDMANALAELISARGAGFYFLIVVTFRKIPSINPLTK